jgi:hypothetical protein
LRLINLRQEFPSQWHRFLTPANPAKGNVFELEMKPELFPWRDAGKTLKIKTLWVLARCTDAATYTVVISPPLPAAPAPPAADPNKLVLARVNQFGGLHLAHVSALSIEISPTDAPTKWEIKMARPGGANLQEDAVSKTMEVEDVMLVLGYSWESLFRAIP